MSLKSRLLLASFFSSWWPIYRQRGRSGYLRQSPFSLKICRPWGQCAVTGTVLSPQGTRWGAGVCRAQWALALGCSAIGTKSRMTPGILKVVECKSTWKPVLPCYWKEDTKYWTRLADAGLPSESACTSPPRWPGEESCWGCLENSVLATAVREDLPSGCSGGSEEQQALYQRSWSRPRLLRGCREVGDTWAVAAPVAVEMLQLPAHCCCCVWGCCAHGWGMDVMEGSEGYLCKADAGENLCLEALSLTLSSCWWIEQTATGRIPLGVCWKAGCWLCSCSQVQHWQLGRGTLLQTRADVLLHASRWIGHSRNPWAVMLLLSCWRLHVAPASPGGLRGRWEGLWAGRECSVACLE